MGPEENNEVMGRNGKMLKRVWCALGWIADGD